MASLDRRRDGWGQSIVVLTRETTMSDLDRQIASLRARISDYPRTLNLRGHRSSCICKTSGDTQVQNRMRRLHHQVLSTRESLWRVFQILLWLCSGSLLVPFGFGIVSIYRFGIICQQCFDTIYSLVDYCRTSIRVYIDELLHSCDHELNFLYSKHD